MNEPTDRQQAAADRVATAGEHADAVVKMDEVIESNRELTQSSRDLARAVIMDREREHKARSRFRILIAAVAAVGIALLAGGFAILLIVLHDQDSIKAGQRASEEARATLFDCVVPSGQCYQDGQQRTLLFINNLNEQAILRAACSPEFVDESVKERASDIAQCIRDNQ